MNKSNPISYQLFSSSFPINIELLRVLCDLHKNCVDFVSKCKYLSI